MSRAQGDAGPASGDLDRRWALVLPHRDTLLRVARARTATTADAEDVVQEAMLRCVEFPSLDEARVLPFLVTVTVRLTTDQHRARTQSERLRRRLSGAASAVAPSPEEAVCDRAEAAWLARYAATLPELQRAVLEAKAEGNSTAETAARLRLTSRAVESLLFRARGTLRTTLARALLQLGLLPVLLRRRRTAIAAVAAASVTVLAAVVAPVLRDDLPRRVPGPGGSERVAGAPAAAVPRAVRSPSGPGARAGARTAVRPQPTPPRRAPEPEPTPIVEVPLPGGGNAGVNDDDDDYSPVERVVHCVRYGPVVTVRPWSGGEPAYVDVRCAKPDRGSPHQEG